MLRTKRAGFSLLEIVMVIAISGLLIAIAVGSLSGQRGRATSDSLAKVLAAELESARTKALRSSAPVAVCFPSGAGTTPQSQGFYLMEGQVRAAPTRVQSWAGDFPESHVSHVYWGSAELPSSTEEVQKAALMAAWLGTSVGQDYAIIFLPDGSVTSNDLPEMDGSYRILVSSGIVASSSSVSSDRNFTPSPNHFQLSQVFAAQTVQISKAGRIDVVSGLVDRGTVELLTSAPATALTTAKLTEPATVSDSEPVIELVEVAPKPFLEPKATVQKERNLSLKVAAVDADGDQLYCSWEAAPDGASPGTGFFSLAEKHPMLWDRESERWISDCTWAPPPQCKVGDKYTLTCKVTDSDGNEVVSAEDVLDPVTVIPPGKIIVFNNHAPAPDVFSINSDGTDERSLLDTGYIGGLSPDGSWIAWANEEDSRRIWLMNADGSGKRQLSTIPNNSGIVWSPDGRYILASTFKTLRAFSVDGSQVTTLNAGSQFFGLKGFSPDGKVLMFVSKDSTFRLAVAEYDDSGAAPVLRDVSNPSPDNETGARHGFVTWLPRQNRQFIYQRTYTSNPETARAEIIDTGVAGPDRFQISDIARKPGHDFITRGIYLTVPVFSPAGDEIAYSKNSVGLFLADCEIRDGEASLRIENERLLKAHDRGAWTVRAWVP